MKKHILFFGITAGLLAACGGGEETEGTEEEIQVEEVCTYSYDESSTELTWTAFKLTDKIGVNGTFDQINVTPNEGSQDMFGVLNGASFELPVGTLNSQDPVRDMKLKNSFFGNLANTASITGSISKLDADGGTVQITMNGVSVDYNGDVEVDGETIKFMTTIDILDFNGQIAMDSLSVVCAEKHTGEDGVNKLWTDVEIAVKTTLVKECK